MKILNDPKRLAAFAQRLNEALDAAGVVRKGLGRQVEVAHALHVSVRGARRWIEGEAYPSPEKLVELAERYHTTVDFLLSGRGALPAGSTPHAPEPPPGHIPHLTWAAIIPWVEQGVAVPDDIYCYLPGQDLVGPRGFAVSVPDDTMLPDFPEAGILYVDPEPTAVSGDYVLARTETGDLTFKRLIRDGGRTSLTLTRMNPPLLTQTDPPTAVDGMR